MRYRVIKKYKRSSANPIKLLAGENIELLEESDPMGEWPYWILCRGAGKEGWVPKQIIDSKGSTGVIIEDYDATEFNLSVTEIIVAIKELNRWIWGYKESDPEVLGWTPLNCVEREQELS